MQRGKAKDLDRIELGVGEEYELESLRQAVVPPHLMLLPFVETPDGVDVEGQERLDEDGVHGSRFKLRGKRPGEGELTVGFRDARTSEVTHRKTIRVAVK